MRRHRYDPNRTRPRTASERRHRKLVGGILNMLRKCIREDRKAKKGA